MTEREIDPHTAVDEMLLNRKKYAKAKAERTYLEEFRKSKKALLMKQALTRGFEAVNAQEREAYADAEYVNLLETLRDQTQAEEEFRWLMLAAQMRVDIWRTQQANDRAEGKAVQ